MQIMFNVLAVASLVASLWVVLYTLKQSQQIKEDIDSIPQMLRLEVHVRRPDFEQTQCVTYHGESLEELQHFLNSISLFRIHDAQVTFNGKTTHYMKANGVLEAV